METAQRQQAIAALVSNVPFDLPNAMIEHQVDRMLDNMNYQLSMQGVGLETYLGYMGMTIPMARQQLRAEAEQKVRGDLILEAIVKNEGIEASDADIEKEVDSIAEEMKKTPEEVREMLGETGTDSVKTDIVERAAMQLVLDKAKMVKAKKKKDENTVDAAEKTKKKKKSVEEESADA